MMLATILIILSPSFPRIQMPPTTRAASLGNSPECWTGKVVLSAVRKDPELANRIAREIQYAAGSGAALDFLNALHDAGIRGNRPKKERTPAQIAAAAANLAKARAARGRKNEDVG
jgi:hypothetical protein